jgi:hypothetical protein
MGIFLLLVMAMAWFAGLRRHGAFSFVTAGLLGFTVYSIPAVLQRVYPFHFDLGSAHTVLVPALPASTVATLVAWAAFGLTVAFIGPAFTGRRPKQRTGVDGGNSFVWALLVLCVGGYATIAWSDGLFFFLAARDEQADTVVRLLWRWANAAGLIAAVMAGYWRAAPLFLIGLVMHFLAGDRTVFVITAFCLTVVTPQGRSAIRLAFRPATLAAVAALCAVAIYGKPIYLAAKLGTWAPLEQAMTAEWLYRYATSYEPFLTFNILDLAIRYDFQGSAAALLKGIVGQILIVPSAFGVDSNQFNVVFTRDFAASITYGIAGNYWAQAWSVGGAVAVAVFAIFYAVVLIACDRWRLCSGSAVRLFLVLTGGLFAVYLHRNSLDNLLSFVRQIVVVVFAASILSRALRTFTRPRMGYALPYPRPNASPAQRSLQQRVGSPRTPRLASHGTTQG